MPAAGTPPPWTSGDCRTDRHAACTLPGSCACVCHRSQAAKLYAARHLLTVEIETLLQRRDLLDERIDRLHHRVPRLLHVVAERRAAPEHVPKLRRRDYGYGSQEWWSSIRACFTVPDEQLRGHEIIEKIATVLPGRWNTATLSTNLSLATRRGYLLRVGVGLYTLPPP